MASKKKNTGKSFENLTKQVFDILTQNDRLTTVEKDVQLIGIDGLRQIDVLVESKVAGIDIRTIIESRDYNKRLDVTHVDGLHSKMQDVKAQKAVLISRRGFSKTAIAKANRLGITLCTLNNPKLELAKVGLEVPILLTDVFNLNVNLKAIVHLDADMQLPRNTFRFINDISIIEYIHHAMLGGRISIPSNSQPFDWVPDFPPPHYIRLSKHNSKHQIEKFSAEISPEVRYLFGYVSDFEGNIVFENLSQGETNLIFKWPDLAYLRENLTEFKNRSNIPDVPSTVNISGVIMPKLSSRDAMEGSLSLKNIESGEMFKF